MFIITIPVATHSIDIDLPQGTPPPTDDMVDPVKNKLVLTDQDQILWNGTPVTEGQLVTLLAENHPAVDRARIAVRARSACQLRHLGPCAAGHQGLGRDQVRLCRQRKISHVRQVSLRPDWSERGVASDRSALFSCRGADGVVAGQAAPFAGHCGRGEPCARSRQYSAGFFEMPSCSA